MKPARTSRVLILAFAVITACGGNAPVLSTTTTTAVNTTTTEAIVIPAFVPEECVSTTVILGPGTTPTVVEPEPLAPDQQMDVLEGVDDAVTDHYLYPDFNGIDWDGGVAALEAEIVSGLDAAVFYERVTDLIASLGDEHSDFETPAERATTEAELAAHNDYVGIGILALPFPELDGVSVLAVFPDSAAAHAGLELHDSIVGIDGIPVSDDPASSFTRLRGPECSLVVVTVRTPGEEDRIVSLVRFGVEGGIPIDARIVPTTDGRMIGYVLIPTLADGSIDDQVATALDAFGPLDGLILDLRENRGGSSHVLDPLLGLFTSGTVGTYVSREGERPLQISGTTVQNSQTVPLVVLIGDDTESYAEIFAGTLAAAGRATLIGETTGGNVETLHAYDLPAGSRIWLAKERFSPTSDPTADWERDGVVPDIVVPSDWQDFTFDTDPALAPALEALNSD
ncbi:MAG: S41 family peptidase [Actinomycetota bacterium]